MIKSPRAFFVYFILLLLPGTHTICAQTSSTASNTVVYFPADKAQNINPDTHLIITFSSAPILGTTGKIRIYDMADNRLIDLLDMSIPAGPTDSTAHQSTIKQPYLQ